MSVYSDIIRELTDKIIEHEHTISQLGGEIDTRVDENHGLRVENKRLREEIKGIEEENLWWIRENDKRKEENEKLKKRNEEIKSDYQPLYTKHYNLAVKYNELKAELCAKIDSKINELKKDVENA